MAMVKERIQLILERENLTQVAFSEMSGINKSTLSHVLTGRNQPSPDVISKILSAFPLYRREWLIAGEEPILRDTTEINVANGAIIAENRNHEELNFTANASKPVSRVISNTQHAHFSSDSNNQKRTERDSLPILDLPSSRSVVKIIVYYDDHTFQTFYPENEGR